LPGINPVPCHHAALWGGGHSRRAPAFTLSPAIMQAGGTHDVPRVSGVPAGSCTSRSRAWWGEAGPPGLSTASTPGVQASWWKPRKPDQKAAGW
jgi:hypothetical protein